LEATLLKVCPAAGCGELLVPSDKVGGPARCPNQADHDRGRNARKNARAIRVVYDSAEWQVTRRIVFKRDGYRCVDCGRRRDELGPTEVLVCDHDPTPVGEILEAGGNPLDPDGCRTRCSTCSGRKDGGRSQGGASEIRARTEHPVASLSRETSTTVRRVVLLCGPAGAGKSTWARESGLAVYDRDDERWAAGGEKNFRIAISRLAHDRRARAVVIRSGPTSSARVKSALLIGATEILVMDTPLDVCVERIKSRRRTTTSIRTQIASVSSWWERYETDGPSPCADASTTPVRGGDFDSRLSAP
jgi:5-methylcytosine-specific restriction endonuclease McrA